MKNIREQVIDVGGTTLSSRNSLAKLLKSKDEYLPSSSTFFYNKCAKGIKLYYNELLNKWMTGTSTNNDKVISLKDFMGLFVSPKIGDMVLVSGNETYWEKRELLAILSQDIKNRYVCRHNNFPDRVISYRFCKAAPKIREVTHEELVEIVGYDFVIKEK